MIVCDGATARAWLRAWGDRAFALGRADRLAADMDGCAAAVERRRPRDAEGYREAARVIRDAQVNFSSPQGE